MREQTSLSMKETLGLVQSPQIKSTNSRALQDLRFGIDSRHFPYVQKLQVLIRKVILAGPDNLQHWKRQW